MFSYAMRKHPGFNYTTLGQVAKTPPLQASLEWQQTNLGDTTPFEIDTRISPRIDRRVCSVGPSNGRF
jgi:hypothetical protein